MVTDAAADCITLPGDFHTYGVEEKIEHVGTLQASVFEIDDAMVAELSEMDRAQRASVMTETYRKLRENIRSIQTALSFSR